MTVATFHSALKSLKIAGTACLNLRRLIALGAGVFVLLLVFPALDLSSSNLASAQTQMQLNKEACDEYKKADAEMNAAYRRITRDYRQDSGFIVALKKAQLAWIRYRDAHLDSIFPGTPASMARLIRCAAA